MRHLRLLAPLAALAVALAAAGCGVPGRTGVVVDGKGRDSGETGSIGGQQLPQGPEGIGTEDEFVKRFLEAPAGDWEGAADRVKQFLGPEEAASWQPPREITVIRLLTGKPEIKQVPPRFEVVLNVQQIGVLTNRGTLEPPTSTADRYTFTLEPVGALDGRLAVKDPPSAMLLADTALSTWYEQRPIYFWDTAQRNLVPDLRYLPAAVEEVDRLNMLIGWLLGGPATWLRPSVLELPEGTKQLGNAYMKDGRLIVNLSGAATGQKGDAATGQSLDRLLAQLCWSLGDDFSGKLVLQIEFVKRLEGSTSDYFDRNPAFGRSRQGAELFAVAGGMVRRVQDNAQPAAEIPNVKEPVNKNVRYAALSDAHAALVRADGDQLRLWVGPDQQGNVVRTALHARTMSRPVLADGLEAGYLAAGGKLYQFTPDEPKKVAEVSVAGLPSPVTSVALAPDGRRLAVVARGKPYLVALGTDGGGSTGPARAVPPPLSNLSGISWLSETRLAMTGTNRSGQALVQVSLDGGVLASTQEVSAPGVTGLVSFPEDPVSGIGGRTMIEADNRAYVVVSQTVQPLLPDKLAPPPAKGVVPTAPFFLE